MIDEIKKDAEVRMKKSIESLGVAFSKVRTGRAHPSLLDGINVNYYGTPTALKQVANIGVEEGRTLTVVPWEKQIIPDVEKAIMAANQWIVHDAINKGLTAKSKKEAKEACWMIASKLFMHTEDQ